MSKEVTPPGLCTQLTFCRSESTDIPYMVSDFIEIGTGKARASAAQNSPEF